jgi:hypothetical protein
MEIKMDEFQMLEIQQFVFNKVSHNYDKEIQKNESKIQYLLTYDNKLEWLPLILIYLRSFYSFSTSEDKKYLDERISYYELLLTYTKQFKIIPKNKLRRRIINE